MGLLEHYVVDVGWAAVVLAGARGCRDRAGGDFRWWSGCWAESGERTGPDDAGGTRIPRPLSSPYEQR